MKIIQIGPYPLSDSIICGGVEASVYGLSKALAKTDEVYVMDIPRMDSCDACEEKDNLKVYRFHNEGKHVIDSVNRISDMLDIIRQLGADVCHIHGTNVFSWKLYRELSRIGITVIVTVHGLVYVEKKKLLKRNFGLKVLYQFLIQSHAERQLLKKAPHLIVDTQYVAETIGQLLGNSVCDLSVIPQGIDVTYEELSCSEDSNEIISVGAFSKRKGHLFLIKAFEKLREKGIDAHLTICGIVSDKNYYQALMDYIACSQYKEQICLRKDISSEELHKMYHKAHLFALHSQEESQGISLVEAMAVGLPVVSTRVGGIPYVIRNEKTGLLSEYGDVASFSQLIEMLMINKNVWKAMSQECRQEATKYKWNNIADNLKIVYQKAARKVIM